MDTKLQGGSVPVWGCNANKKKKKMYLNAAFREQFTNTKVKLPWKLYRIFQRTMFLEIGCKLMFPTNISIEYRHCAFSQDLLGQPALVSPTLNILSIFMQNPSNPHGKVFQIFIKSCFSKFSWKILFLFSKKSSKFSHRFLLNFYETLFLNSSEHCSEISGKFFF